MNDFQKSMLNHPALKAAYESTRTSVVTCTEGSSKAPTAASILQNIKVTIAQLEGEEPFAKLMREQGYDPKDGCVMMLPEAYRKMFGSTLPYFVQYAQLIEKPMLVRFGASYKLWGL